MFGTPGQGPVALADALGREREEGGERREGERERERGEKRAKVLLLDAAS